ncbi:LLM class flavin-dependent oxidoreductase [Sesbania bispinosa]|nr:LLM class flavin-dependent oxidoreductase [Sesbania bispinosa]
MLIGLLSMAMIGAAFHGSGRTVNNASWVLGDSGDDALIRHTQALVGAYRPRCSFYGHRQSIMLRVGLLHGQSNGSVEPIDGGGDEKVSL